MSLRVPDSLDEVLEFLGLHYESFWRVVEFANKTDQTVPSDTMAWSEILVSLLTGLSGRSRKKGTDLEDGSDVKAANVWEAIDTPRFNNVLPAGRVTETAKRDLADMPFIFFVLWDHEEASGLPRCRIWAVRPPADPAFQGMANGWYEAKETGEIKSNNFQLHPPRNKDSDEIRNTYGNLLYPLLFSAVRAEDGYQVQSFDPEVLNSGVCRPA